MAVPPAERDWYERGPEAALEAVDGGSDGLTGAESQRRLDAHGPNELPSGSPVPAWRILLRQFTSPLIYVLAVAAIVALLIGEELDAIFIAAVLAINALVGGIQEYRAEQSSRALQELLETKATVLRDGDPVEVDGTAVVPGDVVVLESGFRVPADVRLLSTSDLEVDESALTGESEAVGKDASWSPAAPEVPLGDRQNMAYAGTVVTRGRAHGVVVETGSETVLGQLAEDVTSVEGGEPPLIVRMERFTRAISVAVVVAAFVVGLVGVLVHGYAPVEMFLFAVAMAVSAIPEGLPVGMTVALGVASRRMANVGVIVRRLVAVEGLGSCTMIATDKTGTLTANELTARRVELADGTGLTVTGEGYDPAGALEHDGAPPKPTVRERVERLVRTGVLCNEASLFKRDDEWTWRGDPTDVALLTLGRKLDVSPEDAAANYPQLDEIPFESKYRFAATFHEVPEGDDGRVRVAVKGAPERVLSMCSEPEGPDREDALARARRLANDGYRVLAVADGSLEAYDESEPPPEPADLTFLGFVGMVDPIRSGVPAAIENARAAGISVTMVTGDHPDTALSIARDLGLTVEGEEVVTGAEVANMDDAALAQAVRETRVFARVSPEQKLDIVRAAREAGQFVAVTGDGVNDAPALREANVGVAMGETGTDVARDAAEIVVSDDNFATIVEGIRQGRIAYDNIRKVIYLLLSTGAGEVILVLLALAAGMPLPLSPVQLLWLNLVTNGIQDVALAFEPEEDDALDRSPREPDERIFNRLMLERTGIAAATMGVVGFLTFAWLLEAGLDETAVRNHLLFLFVCFEIVNIGSARSERKSMLELSPLRSPILLAGTTAAFLVHLAAMDLAPARTILETSPLPLETIVLLGVVSLSVGLAMEIHTWWRRWTGRFDQ